MSAEDKEVRVVSTREHTTKEYSFDALAKGLAGGTISRRKALKLVGTAILGGGVLAFFPAREAEAQDHCGDRPGCGRQCRNTRKNCRCVRVRSSAGTNVRCVYPCCSGRTCSVNANCRSGELCMVTDCCRGQTGGVCVTQCPNEPRPGYCFRSSSSTTAAAWNDNAA